MIATNEELRRLLDDWEGIQRLAVDTEADSLFSYREKLCLVQLGDCRENLLLDPLSGVDMQPLLDFMGRHCIILHGASYDIRMLKSVGEFQPCEVFDTMLAARMTGRTKFSLAALVEEFFGVELPKAARKADWGKRPLPEKMAEYAKNDTRYLHEIAERLQTEIERLGRMEWFRQCCGRDVEAAIAPDAPRAREAWMVKGAFRLGPRASAVLREIWSWRDAEAEQRDVPPFKIMNNEDMLRFAEEADSKGKCSAGYLRGGRSERFQQAVRRALDLDESEWPSRKKSKRLKTSPDFEKRVDDLIAIRNRHAGELNLEPSFIAPRKAIERIVAAEDDDRTPDHGLLPWQLALLRPEG